MKAANPASARRATRAATPKPALTLDLQIKSRARHVPSRRVFATWIAATLAGRTSNAVELTLRVVGPGEMRTLNRDYRGRDYATNVLSFPFTAPAGVKLPVQVLGDIVLCAQTVQQEAKSQGKTLAAHWAHLTVHGALHLLGMDHTKTRAAAVMEGAEISVLATLGYSNPYHTGDA